MPVQIAGPHGTAGRVPAAHLTDNPATLDAWIITAPGWHPLWGQYLLALLTLADVPGQPPAVRHRPGTTHELLVAALNPEQGPYDAATVTNTSLHLLTPVNIAEQVTTTDEQARQLPELCVRAVLDGVLNPETGDAPERIRAAWSRAVQQTLDHGRDPHHGRAV